MAIVTQTDKRTGITYAYETQYHWDKEKKQLLQLLARPDPNLLFRRDICIMVPRICLISSQKNSDSQLI